MAPKILMWVNTCGLSRKKSGSTIGCHHLNSSITRSTTTTTTQPLSTTAQSPGISQPLGVYHHHCSITRGMTMAAQSPGVPRTSPLNHQRYHTRGTNSTTAQRGLFNEGMWVPGRVAATFKGACWPIQPVRGGGGGGGRERLFTVRAE